MCYTIIVVEEINLFFTLHYHSGMLGFFTKKQGLTLIELLIVLAIVGLLISVLVVSFGGPKEQANDARRTADIQQILKAMDLCYDDSDCGAGANQYISTTGGANAVTTIGTYLPSVPIDPVNSSPYQYAWIDNSEDATEYCVYTKLEAPATDTWIAVSHKGIRMDLTTNPSTVGIDCWE